MSDESTNGARPDPIQKIAEEYHRLCHAMQSGVKAWMNYDGSETSPKHLRVGINSAIANEAALSRLLIRKGVITDLEYVEAIRDGMAREVQAYEEKLRGRVGPGILLG